MTPSSTLAYDFGCLRPGHQYGLRLHLLGYAETIEDTSEIDTARATCCGIRIDNSASVMKGLRERVGRADIWLWRSRTNRHRNGGPATFTRALAAILSCFCSSSITPSLIFAAMFMLVFLRNVNDQELRNGHSSI
jgi:hypothetical protein